jgi:hypothetical protein
MRVAVGLPNLINYRQGGGHWTWAIQYCLALQQAGCELLCLFVAPGSRDRRANAAHVQRFLARFELYCPRAECCVILYPRGGAPELALAASSFYGLERAKFEAWAKEAVLWNLAGTVPKPFLDLFRRRVFIDGDPGHLHVSALQVDLGLEDHDRFLSVGLNLGNPSCLAPLHGKFWTTFPQVLFLDMWKPQPDPGFATPFSSITHWTWDELEWNGRRLSCSKREAYLEILQLPRLSSCAMSLAANRDDPEDRLGDKNLFESFGWKMLEAWAVAGSPEDYMRFIAESRAEICAPKPIYVDLNTGWISDRSVGYLATGRPVLMKETGISEHLPTGEGLVTFRSVEEAAERAKEIDRNYAKHAKRARSLAVELLDSRKILPRMLEACQ